MMPHRSGSRALVFLLILFMVSFVLTTRVLTIRPPAPPFPEDVRGEDRMGRDDFDWLRLHDPGTGQIPASIRAKELAFAATLPTKQSSSGKERLASSLATVWSPAGPTNLQGRVRALAFDLTDAATMLAGGVSGSMYRSIDGGTTWHATSGSDQHSGVTCIAQDPRPGKRDIWYYGTGENGNNSQGYWGGNGSYHFGDGIYKSTDGGQSWLVLPATVPASTYLWSNQFQFTWRIAVDPVTTAQDIVYAACWGSIQRSTDGGSTWAQVLGSGYQSPAGVDLAVTTTGVLYATLNSFNTAPGIWRSTNGTAWTSITPPGWPTTYQMAGLAIAPSNQNVVYVLASTPGAGLNDHSLWKYTYVSGDGSGAGGTWENRSAAIPNFAANAGRKFDSYGGTSLTIAVKPDNVNVVYIGGMNLYRSTNGFATADSTTWIGGYSYQGVNSPYSWWGGVSEPHHADQHQIQFFPGLPQTMYSMSDGGIRRTANDMATPVDWSPVGSGLVSAQYFTVAIDHASAGNDLIVGGLQDRGTFFGSAAAGTVVPIDAGDGAYCAIADGRTSYYTSSQFGVTFRSIRSDDGILHGFTRIDPLGLANELFLASFALDPTDNARMYFAGGRILWRNNNLTAIPLGSYSPASLNWDALSSTQLYGADQYVSAIGASTNPANRVYYGSTYGQVYRLDGADTGTPAPTDVWSGKGFPASAYVGSIAVNPSNADSVLLSFSNYGVQSIFFTTDGGTSWSPVSGNLEQGGNPSGNGPSVRWLKILPRAGGNLYFAGTSVGLFSTSTLNGGSTVWAQEGASEIGNTVVDMIDVRSADGFVAAATHGMGLFTAKFPLLELTESVQDGWNIVSVPVGGSFRKPELYPGATTRAYAYQGSYQTEDTLEGGAGYWVKFGSAQSVNYPGYPVARETIAVASSWNLIGSISSPVAVSGITSIPGGLVTSKFFGYGGSYSVADSIIPGRGYWVKVSQGGKLIIASAAPASEQERIRIVADADLPPAPPPGLMSSASERPLRFALEQNYPNPFNPRTTIRYALPSAGRVTLKVYSVTGQEIATLVDAVQDPGFKSVDWDAGKVASGVYLYRISAGSITATGKMVLAR